MSVKSRYKMLVQNFGRLMGKMQKRLAMCLVICTNMQPKQITK